MATMDEEIAELRQAVKDAAYRLGVQPWVVGAELSRTPATIGGV